MGPLLANLSCENFRRARGEISTGGRGVAKRCARYVAQLARKIPAIDRWMRKIHVGLRGD